MIDLKEPVGWFVIPFKTIFSNEKEKFFLFIKGILLKLWIFNFVSYKINTVEKILILDKSKFLDLKIKIIKFWDFLILKILWLRNTNI